MSVAKSPSEDAMRQVVRLSVAALAATVLVHVTAPARAQSTVKQIELSEKQIQGFIAGHKDVTEAIDKMPPEADDATADAQLSATVKKFGFKDHNEYEDVVDNIAMVMFGIDPKTKEFTDPPTLTKKMLEDAQADKSMPDADRKQLVSDLTEELKVVQPIRYPSNVDLVRKYYDKIEPLLK
jgi:hypothetical protein